MFLDQVSGVLVGGGAQLVQQRAPVVVMAAEDRVERGLQFVAVHG